MTKFVFTATRLDGLEAKEKRHFIYDEKQPGLRLYVTPTGVKTFQFQARSKTLHKIVSSTLGKYPGLSIREAREQAAALLAEVNAGVNIETKKRDERRKRQLDPTVREFAAEYIERYAKERKKSWKNDQDILDRHILKGIGNLKMSEVRKRDVVGVIDKIKESGKLIMANRTQALLSKVFNFAVERDVIEYSPVQGMPKKTPEKARVRVLSDSEIVALWNALGDSPANMALKLILVTGQRPGEVRNIEWENYRDGIWTIPSEKTKNGLTHVVPLNSYAIEIIEAMRESYAGQRYVFPGKYGNKPLVETVPRNAMRKATDQLGWHEKGAFATPHDLRRTMRTNLSKLGVEAHISERLLNHKQQGMSSVYDHYEYFNEKTAAMKRWGNHLQKVLSGNTKNNIIYLQQ